MYMIHTLGYRQGYSAIAVSGTGKAIQKASDGQNSHPSVQQIFSVGDMPARFAEAKRRSPNRGDF